MNRIPIVMRAVVICFLVMAECFPAVAQSLSEQKSTVAFIFGTVHPLGPDKAPLKRPDGKATAVEMALGTGFFVAVPEPRLGPDAAFPYFVTAKHVLKDFDGTYLPKIKLRLNLNSPTTDMGCDFNTEVPVADLNGNLLWLHTDAEADDVALIPFLPDRSKYSVKAIPTGYFVDEASLKSDEVEEGDNLYFIGLMEQYYGSKKNYPVVRKGTLALMTNEAITTPTGQQKVFIAELESWPGNSGAPVFLSLGGLRKNAIYVGGSVRLLGILVGGFLNNMSAPVVDNSLTWVMGNGANTGVSFIVPAPRIKEILERPELKRIREDEVVHKTKSR